MISEPRPQTVATNGRRLNSCKVQEVLTVVNIQEVLTVVKHQEVLEVVNVQEVPTVVKVQEVLTVVKVQEVHSPTSRVTRWDNLKVFYKGNSDKLVVPHLKGL